MIDFHLAASESGACWEAFLRDLYQRGLSGSPCKLIATDGGSGLHQALEIVYPKILLQRCWAHKTRNVFGQGQKERSAGGQASFKPHQPCWPMLEERGRPTGDFLPAGTRTIPGR